MKTVRIRALRSDSVRGEADWIPSSLDDVAHVRTLLTDAGYSASIVSGLSGWLIAKATGEEDLTSKTTRSQYRRILAELDASSDDGEPKRLVAA